MKADSSIRWTEIERRFVTRTPIFDLMETQALSPDGKASSFTVIDTCDWGIVIPVIETPKGRSLLMVHQWRHGSNCESLEFPGGVIERGESAENGVRRELLEETGYRCSSLELLASLSPNPAIMSNRVHIFAAQGLEASGIQSLDENEYLNIVLVKEEEVLAQIGKPPYIHALMTAALGLYIGKIKK